MSNNFTYLDDIIDMDEPGNDNENNNFNQRQQPSKPSRFTSQNSHREQYNKNSYTPEIITENRNLQQYKTNMAPSSNLTYRIQKLNNPTSQSYFPPPEPPRQETFPVYTSPSDLGMDMSMNINSSEYVNNYNELCEICMKINNKNNMMFHYIYLMIIITLIIIMLMLLKKVLNV